MNDLLCRGKGRDKRERERRRKEKTCKQRENSYLGSLLVSLQVTGSCLTKVLLNMTISDPAEPEAFVSNSMQSISSMTTVRTSMSMGKSAYLY